MTESATDQRTYEGLRDWLKARLERQRADNGPKTVLHGLACRMLFELAGFDAVGEPPPTMYRVNPARSPDEAKSELDKQTASMDAIDAWNERVVAAGISEDDYL